MMKTLIHDTFRYRPWQPRHLRIVANDLKGVARQPEHDHRTHLKAAIDWLCNRESLVRDGLSSGWTFASGWQEPSAASSGMAIETLIAAARYLDQPELRQESIRLAAGLRDAARGEDFELADAGAVLQGLLAGHAQLGQAACLDAAHILSVKMAHQLSGRADQWGLHAAASLWPMTRTGMLTGDSHLLETVETKLHAMLGQQTPSGWLRPYGTERRLFTNSRIPYLHDVASTLRACLEISVLLNNAGLWQRTDSALRPLMALQRQDGWLSGAYDDGWAPVSTQACVTGLAQMAINWLRMWQISGEREYRDAAWKAIAYVKRTQRAEGQDATLKGAVPATAPVWGACSRFAFPALAAKFFADALMMDMTNTVIPPVQLNSPGGISR